MHSGICGLFEIWIRGLPFSNHTMNCSKAQGRLAFPTGMSSVSAYHCTQKVRPPDVRVLFLPVWCVRCYAGPKKGSSRWDMQKSGIRARGQDNETRQTRELCCRQLVCCGRLDMPIRTLLACTGIHSTSASPSIKLKPSRRPRLVIFQRWTDSPKLRWKHPFKLTQVLIV